MRHASLLKEASLGKAAAGAAAMARDSRNSFSRPDRSARLSDCLFPDIGDFVEVAVIELLVKPGDSIKPEQRLITVESDKASMEIPSSHGGVVKGLKVKHFESLGVSFADPVVDINKLRTHKEKVVGKLTGGLAAMAKMRKVTVVRGLGSFVGAHHLQAEETEGAAQEKSGKKQTIAFKSCIVAANSTAGKTRLAEKDIRLRS